MPAATCDRSAGAREEPVEGRRMVTAQDKLFRDNGWLRTLVEVHEGPAANQHFSGLKLLLKPVDVAKQ